MCPGVRSRADRAGLARAGLVTAVLGVLTAWPPAAGARLDVEDRGPVLDAGAFAMRVTNAGILGNAFFDIGRSFDPSFEFPRGSGHEALGHAELWVGALAEDGHHHVSGAPELEWRPTLDSGDVVRGVRGGAPGSLWDVDDDGDGRVDEDPPNGLDEDGDGRTDEDSGTVADQWLVARFRDDQPEAVAASHGGGEAHEPMHLAVTQEARTWATPGFDRIAGYAFTITNVGNETLHGVRCGVYADLDSRDRRDATGHLDDRLEEHSYALEIPEGISTLGPAGIRSGTGAYRKTCVTRLEGDLPIVRDGRPGTGLPVVAIVGLSHTTDPLGYLVNTAFPGVREAAAASRAPRRDTTFQFACFAQGLPPGQGGPPILDEDRYAAMAGTYPTAARDQVRDWAVLLSCGPFARLAPGERLDFSVAFVVGEDADSVMQAVLRARLAWRGTRYSRIADARTDGYNEGTSGINGHEICYEPPPGVVFNYDPHCPPKFYSDPAYQPPPDALTWLHETEVTYQAGRCIWSDLDCDACTGLDGKETHVPWQVGGVLPPKPAVRVSAEDSAVVVRWDNTPEIVLQRTLVAHPGYQFGGYRLYRLDDWRRNALVPGPERWQRIGAFRPAGLEFAGAPLSPLVDASVASDGTLYGQTHYPVGRYRFRDPETAYGFDYLYAVTTVLTKVTLVQGAPAISELESPLTGDFDDRVVPHAPAKRAGDGVWVVPNPYRGRAQWERAPVPGDVFTRHVDFFGLPRARCRIRVYTLAGDLVAELDHDGTNGDGQAPWNLISRNGQDVESGVYLFSVDSSLGHQVGRFVIIR